MLDTPDVRQRPLLPLPRLLPRPGLASASRAPILVVVPSQPKAPSIALKPPTSNVPFVLRPAPPPPSAKQARFLPDPSLRPCAACNVPKCGGLRKRYTPSKAKTQGSTQKIFTFCPTTNKSTTPGFTETIDTDYNHFKRVVDDELERRRATWIEHSLFLCPFCFLLQLRVATSWQFICV